MHHFMAATGPMSLFAAFVAGAAGSVHCLAMCGGLSGALGMRARRSGAGAGKAFAHTVTYQAGRISSYCIAGALVGAFGGLLQSAADFNRVAAISRVVAGVVLVLAAVGVLFEWRPLRPMEILGGRVWSRMAPLARSIPSSGLRGALLLGMVWGWLPCGLIYSMLLVAALAGGAAQGAATMLSFGIGTAPTVVAAALLSGLASRAAMTRGLNVAAGSLLLLFGLLTMLAPFDVLSHH